VSGTVDLQTNSGAIVYVAGGLTLNNSTIQLGKPDGSTSGQLYFLAPSQTIDGGDAADPGVIDFGASIYNSLQFGGNSGDVLTLGSHLNIHGNRGSFIAYNSSHFDNQATITADPEGHTPGTLSLNG
jgi:hypothetical protein